MSKYNSVLKVDLIDKLVKSEEDHEKLKNDYAELKEKAEAVSTGVADKLREKIIEFLNLIVQRRVNDHPINDKMVEIRELL